MIKPAGEVLGTREFTNDDQVRFASISGDHNEIHLDPVAARRAMGGEQVVHGMHTVLWALDRYLSLRPPKVVGISATFRKPVHLGEEVEARLVEESGSRARVSVVREGTRLIDLRLELGNAGALPGPDDRITMDLPREPLDLRIEDISDLSGALPVSAGEDRLVSDFTSAVAGLGEVIPAQLAAVSRLVGMVCPGRYSMLSGVDLRLNHGGSASQIDWRVSRADSRVAAVSMDLSGGRLEGSVHAFFRPRPTLQPTMAQVGEVIERGEFAGQRALVVGGSRGLGELTAKLLTSGGADVILTWLRAEGDAMRVVEDIRSGGATADPVRLDVADPMPAIEALSADGWLPSHLYYYATPPIFVRRTSLFDQRLFDRFAEVYVGGFARVIEACRHVGAQHLTVLYPSSLAVQENLKALAEYAAAKAAGEVAARILGSTEPWLTVVMRRLPRLPTDQTATFMPVPADDPLAVMTAVVRDMASPPPVAGKDNHPE